VVGNFTSEKSSQVSQLNLRHEAQERWPLQQLGVKGRTIRRPGVEGVCQGKRKEWKTQLAAREKSLIIVRNAPDTAGLTARSIVTLEGKTQGLRRARRRGRGGEALRNVNLILSKSGNVGSQDQMGLKTYMGKKTCRRRDQNRIRHGEVYI